MNKLNKADFVCLICNNILHDPIDLPCDCGNCTICKKHLKDNSVKDGSIRCETCKEQFLIKDIKIKVNKFAKIVLDSEQHLSNEEIHVKSEINNLLNTLHQLNEEFTQNREKVELNCHEHFSELKRQIDTVFCPYSDQTSE